MRTLWLWWLVGMISGCGASVASPPGSATGTTSGEAAVRFLGQLKPVLYGEDVLVSTRFYVDVLGFENDPQAGAGYAEMHAGTQTFGLHAPTNARERARVGQQRLYFRIDDVVAHRARVIARGGEAGEILVTDWMTMFSVSDRDGHEITFAQTDAETHSVDPW